ncbi:MAG: Cof-type HAD-IIB family hydrolase [Clostridiales bacterium]|nr:Cof-type HAD-IIB family hydrolase [Clostridiales bacterium]
MNGYDIRLIALDLDGTTLDSKGRLSARTKGTLEAAAKKGVHVVISTGRAYSALPADVFAIDGLRYILTSNGASVTDIADGRQVYSNCIGPEALDRAVALLRNFDFLMEFFIQGRAYVEKSMYDRVEAMNFTEKHRNYIKKTRQPVANLLDFALRHRAQVENINVNFENQADRGMMRGVLATLEGVTLTTSFDHNLEIGGATTSKAEAIKAICGMLGVACSEVMACGDSPNDAAMLRAAGLSVAMGNAKDELKAIAKHVTLTNDDDGVAEAVEAFVLKGRFA